MVRASRRDVLELGLGAAIAACGGTAGRKDGEAADAGDGPGVGQQVATGPLPTRPLGKTGLTVTTFGLGGQATLQTGDREGSLAIIQRALDLGVTYFDTSKVYGSSEDYLGEGLAGRRDGVVLATKTHDRTRDGSLRHLDDSLKRLRTDRVDVWQLHNVQTMAELDAIFAPGGAIEALEKARDDKRVRFVGITGHFDPDVLLEGIRRYPFDTILMAINIADPHLRSFAARLLPAAVDRQMGIVGMKVTGARALFGGGTGLSIADALPYVWTHPVSVAIVGCDTPAHVETNAALARGFRPLDAQAMRALEDRAAPVAQQALWFRRPA
jgi:hypothetical protein